MKAILVMEMPENCLKCPMEMDVEDTSGSKWQGNICRGCGKRQGLCTIRNVLQRRVGYGIQRMSGCDRGE